MLAWIWRFFLFRTTFIAITGSLGKTTAKECLAAILSPRRPTVATFANQNDRWGVPRTILRVRPWHRYAVVEIGIDSALMMRRSAGLVRPDVVVMLGMKRTHSGSFRSLDERAAAKALLLRRLRRGGVALLFADDPRVAAMGKGARFRVSTFGTSSSCDLRAEEIGGRWPARLRLRVRQGPESHAVETRLVGEHWVPSVLGAVAAATAVGVPLADAARAILDAAPFAGRMQPVLLPNRAIVLRDDYNASHDALDPALRVLGEASALRRVAVVTDFSDYDGNRKRRLRYLAPAVTRAAEVALFVGEGAAYGRRQAIAAGMRPENVHAVKDLREAAELLRSELRAGDLVLLKGRTTDHATRIFFALLGDVSCWRQRCRKQILCDFCPELGVPESVRCRAVAL